jgi:hypothetical protein
VTQPSPDIKNVVDIATPDGGATEIFPLLGGELIRMVTSEYDTADELNEGEADIRKVYVSPWINVFAGNETGNKIPLFTSAFSNV